MRAVNDSAHLLEHMRGDRRHMHSADSSSAIPPPLLCPARANVGKLAGAMANRIQQDTFCEVESVGPEALLKALKSVIFAERYLQEAQLGKCLGAAPRKVVVPAKAAGLPETSMIRLRVRPLPEQPARLEQPHFLAAGDTNPGLLAADIAACLRESGAVSVGSMGAHATSRSVKAIMIAQVYLASMLGQRKELVMVPHMDSFATRDEERFRVVLSCLLWSETLTCL